MIIINKAKTIEEIYTLLCLFDKDFIPNLVERIGSLEEYAEKLFKYSDVFYMQFNQEIVGFAAVYMNGKTKGKVYIAQIAAKSNNEIKGIGSLLLKHIINLVRKKRKQLIELEVYKKNFRAIKLYEKFGFKIDNFSDSDFLKMIKILDR